MSFREQRATAEGSPSSPGEAISTPEALYQAGLRHLQAGQHSDAQARCRQALAIDPQYADNLYLMGLLALEAGQNADAIEWFARAIARQPKADYVCSLGTALRRAGRLDEAAKALDKAVQLRPDDAALWTSLGFVLQELKRPSEALLCFQHALKLAPRDLDAACQSAVLLHQSGRPQEALVHFDLCDELRPDHAATIGSRSLVLRDLKRFEDYLAGSRRAHALDPTNIEICNNAGDALLLLGRFGEAIEWFDRALELRPSAIFVLENKVAALRNMHRFEELFALHDQIRSMDPSNARAELTWAQDRLLVGDFDAGWQGREARRRVAGLPLASRDGPEPIWTGKESIEGKSILVYSDEGLGDAIQFARYVPMLAARGARVILVVQDPLVSLLSTIAGLSQCLPASSPTLPPVDFRCSVNSLPFAFKTTLDTIPPPLHVFPAVERIEAWQQRLGVRDRLRIGLVWSGNPAHAKDSSRSMPLQSLTGILDVDATFVSMQRDPRPDDKAWMLACTDIVDLTGNFTDFSETAALVQCLDLVITVDTSVAHLAASMGCATCILLPFLPDHRWMLERDDSPWYPTARLFRQTESRDYATVLERVRAELLTLISAH